MQSDIVKSNWFLLLLWMGLTASALLARPPLPIDETRYLSVAWEMWQNNQFLVPHVNGLPYSHKPPLLFWLIQLGWWLFGVNEWSARLTAPLFGLVCLFLTKRLAAILWPSSPDIGRLAPLVLLSTGMWSIYGTLTMFDTLVVFFSLAAYLIIVRQAKSPTLYSWPLLGLILGLAFLAKGPVALVYIAPPLLLAPLWQKGQGTNWWLWYGGCLASLFIGCVLALTWALPASFAGGQDYGRAILFSQTAGRMTQSFAHQRPFYWYLLLLPAVLLPWSLWLPSWRGGKINGDQSLRFCLCIIVPAFLALSLISGKQIHYLLPLLPIAAILFSKRADSASAGKPHAPWIYLIFYALLAIAFFVLPILPIQGRDAVILKYIPFATGAVPLCTGFVLVWLWNRTKTDHHLVIIATCFILHLTFLQITLSKPVNTLFNPAVIIRSLSLADKEGKKLAVYPSYLDDQFQFAARLTKPVAALKDFQEMQTWSQNNPDGSCLIFIAKEKLPMFGKETDAIPYKDRWLLFRSARQLGNVHFNH
jgi:4-amino-4-deoxy-L-arabinose transferase-like glycosyltransferase